jgi:hypothetical protein
LLAPALAAAERDEFPLSAALYIFVELIDTYYN